MTENRDVDEQVTIGGPVLPPAASDGALYVGPPDDPDRYELRDGGTRGGEGRTWRASYRGGLNSPLVEAVKMLFPPEGSAAAWPTEADLRHWHDNAALLRHLAQPHVVQLHDIFAGEAPHRKGAAGGGRSVAYLTMEWVEGPTLAAHLRGIPVTAATLAERLQYIEHIATAVASLHSHTRSAGNPVLHRDLTPANCIVHATRGIVLIDISGMRLVDDGFDPLGRHTPGYTAPEVLRAPHQARYPSSDLYAVGAVATFVLTGQDPEVDAQRQSSQRERLSALLREAGSGSAEAAARHLLAMLNPDPAERPGDVLVWSQTLTRLAAPASRRRSRARSLLAGVAGVLAAGLAVAGGVYALQNDGSSPATRGAIKATTGPTSPTSSTNDALGPVRAASAGFSPVDFYSTSGRITSLRTGDKVRDCERITGTAAELAPGQTLVLTQHGLDGGDNLRYVQVMYEFQQAKNGSTWRSAQFFNDGAIGKRALLELIELPYTPALVAADDSHDYKTSSALAAKGKVIAAVTVVHVKKRNPDCV
ncbi:MAG TPA: protein kinase [Kineosporiaceae bacterium]|nr:protein kinase [Kineosporiaceae bacterium]